MYIQYMSTSKQRTHRQARAHALELIHTPVGRSNKIYYELKTTNKCWTHKLGRTEWKTGKPLKGQFVNVNNGAGKETRRMWGAATARVAPGARHPCTEETRSRLSHWCDAELHPLRAPPEPALPLFKEIPTDMHRLLITALLIVNVTEYFVSTYTTWETIYITRCPKALPSILFTVIGIKGNKMLSSKEIKMGVYREINDVWATQSRGFSY